MKCQCHRDDIDDYVASVLDSVEEMAREHLPKTGGGEERNDNRRRIPGWTEFVTPFQNESKFWFAVWQSANKPKQGDLFNIMKTTKNQYKYAVRRLKKSQDKISNDRLVSSVIDGGANIFKEVKKLRGNIRTCSSRIDGVIGSSNIANHFATTYSELYLSLIHI